MHPTPFVEQEIMEIFLHWLRENGLSKTECCLIQELESMALVKRKENEKYCLVTENKQSNFVVLEASDKATRVLSFPLENNEGLVEQNKQLSPTEVTNDDLDCSETNELKSCGLEQLCQQTDSNGSPYSTERCKTNCEPNVAVDQDEWLLPDDVGYLRVLARPNAEYYEICGDEEHQQLVQQYLVEEQSYLASCGPPSTQTSCLEPCVNPGQVIEEYTEEQSENDIIEEVTSPSEDTKTECVVQANLDCGEHLTLEKTQSLKSISEKQNEPEKNVVECTPTQSSLQESGINNFIPILGPKPQLHNPKSMTPVFEAFDLKVIYQVHRTGFEEHKDYPIRMYDIIAGRYQILEYLGSAAFSRAVQCVDLKTGQLVCIKIIRNNKDFFDQGLDEIKLLHYIHAAGNPDENCVLQLYDYFYHKEHLFLVCELLRDNLYEFSKYNRESGDELYFNLPRLQKITRQILIALRYIHHLNLIHCDLKPENILIKSYSRCEVKVIDFGSSCFITDHLSSYVQSRCYRAPEVVLGLPYSELIDMWSLGAILAELYCGRVLFHNDSLSTMMARIVAICGSFPTHMLRRARYANRFFTREGVLYEKSKQSGHIYYLYPKRTRLHHRIGTKDTHFNSFLSALLQLDPSKRPTAEQALQHPFLIHDYANN